jgi:hypothetical protein
MPRSGLTLVTFLTGCLVLASAVAGEGAGNPSRRAPVGFLFDQILGPVIGQSKSEPTSALGNVPPIRIVSLSRDRIGALFVNAGTEQGLTAGTVLSVLQQSGPDGSGRILGYVQVSSQQLETTRARVAPCAFAGVAARPVSELEESARCKVVEWNYRSLGLRVVVEAVEGKGEVALLEVDRLAKGLAAEQKNEPAPLFRIVKDRPDWLVRVDGTGSYIVENRDHALARDAAVSPWQVGPFASGGDSDARIKEVLHRIARATTLIRLTRFLRSGLVGDGRPSQFRVGTVVHRNGLDTSPRLVREFGDPEMRNERAAALTELHDRDIIEVLMQNNGAFPLDITVLSVGADYGINTLFPSNEAGVDNRLAPGRSLSTKGQISDATIGVERIIVAAIRGRGLGAPVLFNGLEQVSIFDPFPDARVRRVEELLSELFPNSGPKARGALATEELEQIEFRMFTWRTVRSKGGR